MVSLAVEEKSLDAMSVAELAGEVEAETITRITRGRVRDVESFEILRLLMARVRDLCRCGGPGTGGTGIRLGDGAGRRRVVIRPLCFTTGP
jgi:hypothetical protein